MNLMFLASLALALICMLVGYRRGLVKSILGTLGVIGAIILSNVLNPYVSEFMAEHTAIRESVRAKIVTAVGMDERDVPLTVNDRESYLEGVDIPEIIKKCIRNNHAGKSGNGLEITDFSDYVIDYLTDMVMKGIAYALTFAITLLIILIVFAMSEIMSGIPIVNGINRFGGLLFGLAQALFIIWVSMLLITFMSAFSWASQMMNLIDESRAMSFIYEKNIFLKIVVDILENI